MYGCHKHAPTQRVQLFTCQHNHLSEPVGACLRCWLSRSGAKCTCQEFAGVVTSLGTIPSSPPHNQTTSICRSDCGIHLCASFINLALGGRDWGPRRPKLGARATPPANFEQPIKLSFPLRSLVGLTSVIFSKPITWLLCDPNHEPQAIHHARLYTVWMLQQPLTLFLRKDELEG